MLECGKLKTYCDAARTAVFCDRVDTSVILLMQRDH